MMRVWLEGIGLMAPGLTGWEGSAPVLAGQRPYIPEPLPRLAPAILAPDLRRRTTEHIRIGIEVAEQAVRMAGADASTLATVFASSESDGALTHNICEEVAKDQPQVSPTRFHNSVNNAPAGYWCMSVGAREPSSSVVGWDASFTIGLLEAVLQVLTEERAVLLVAHDTPLPPPLHALRPFTAPVGVALLLRPNRAPASMTALDVELREAAADTQLDDPGLEALRQGNPAGRALPLLALLARGHTGCAILPHTAGLSLRAEIGPA